jgi:Na+-driven multidrug efflux pump
MKTTFGVAKFKGFLLVATFSMLIEFLMGFADSVIAGNLLGETALAGLNLLQSPMNFVSFVACLLGTGTAICFSTEIGRFDRDRAAELFSQGMFGAALFGVIGMLAFIIGRDPFLGMFGASKDVISYAVPYWNWFVPNVLLEPIAVMLASAVYADGGARLCFGSYIVQLFGNCVVSYVLCKAMGISGCALGSTVGNIGAILFISCHFLRRGHTLRLVRHFAFRDLLRICKSSFGDASVRLCWALLFMLLNAYVISRFGSETLPVLNVVIAVIGFSEAFNGTPNAAQPIVGVYRGEGNTLGVRTVMRAATCVATLFGGVVLTILMCWPQVVVGLLGIDDPNLVPASCTAVRIVASGLVCTALVLLFNSYYLFIEREWLACSLTVLANLVVPVALFPVCGKLFGINGVWAALGIAPVATALLFCAFLLVRYGRRQFPLLLPNDREVNLHVLNLILSEKEIADASKKVGEILTAAAAPQSTVLRAALMVEEVLMAVKDRNGERPVRAEVTLDLNGSEAVLILRDDGEVFNITDADARITSLRTYLVASVMEYQPKRMNLTTIGYNRNIFKFEKGSNK